MGSATPCVTIGMPVYNGAESIEEAINCILDGTYQNVKILVSDNCSTDNTQAIVSNIVERDARVHLIKNPQNIGPVPNFCAVAAASDTDLFMWRAHDDITASDYIEKLVACLDANPEAVLAAAKIITSKPNKVRERPFPATNRSTLRWPSMMKANAGWMYGLFRRPFIIESVSNVLENYPHIHAWDMMVLLDALMAGGICGTNETTFVHQQHRPKSARDQAPQQRERARDFKSGVLALPFYERLNTAARLGFNAMLPVYIERRVARLHHRF